MQRTEIASLGHFKLIEHLTKNIELQNLSSLIGVGEDAAIIDHYGKKTVVSTDLLIENIHFDLIYTPLKHLGYKTVIAGISDIYGMFAEPTQILLSLGISNRFSVEALEDFYEGVYLACKNYGIDLVGGDTASSNKGFIINITAIGESSENYVLRSTAQNGDLICVSGDLGAPFLGLTFLEREKKIFLENPNIQPNLDNQTYVIGKYLKPEFPKQVISWLKEKNILPTAIIDITDGLSSDILQICEKSQKGCMIYEEKIPIEEETKLAAYTFQIDPTLCALSGGEEYQLLLTLNQKDYDAIKNYADLHIIGYITEDKDKKLITTKNNQIYPLTAQGWQAENN